jgi:hypothetical protein
MEPHLCGDGAQPLRVAGGEQSRQHELVLVRPGSQLLGELHEAIVVSTGERDEDRS